MTKTLVVGIGNPFRGDDAAGLAAADRMCRDRSDVRLRLCQELPPELADEVGAYDTVIFVDASVRSEEVISEELHPSLLVELGSHSGTPASILAMADLLYDRLPRRVFLVHIPAASFEVGEKLSQRTAAGIEAAVQLGQRMLDEAMASVST